mgnify:CR=1 FL=1|jgi:hypothetical protein
MTIRGDSQEYDLLKKWTETLPFYEEPKFVTTVEIGVREGLGSKVIMLAIKERLGGAKIPYKHIGIDPYANLKYQHYDTSPEYTADYTDEMKQQMVKDFEDHPEFIFYHMKDTEFMNEFVETGFKVYDLVHFDGPHMTKDVLREAIWFADKSRVGTRFIFDDYKKYKMDHIALVLTHFGFKTKEAGENKICLQRAE